MSNDSRGAVAARIDAIRDAFANRESSDQPQLEAPPRTPEGDSRLLAEWLNWGNWNNWSDWYNFWDDTVPQ